MTDTLPAGWHPAAGCLRDKTLLVTGAGDGIGRALALACARHGATIVLLGRTQDKLEAVYDEIVAAGGPEPAMVPLNLSVATVKEYDQLAVMLQNAFGKLDGIVHNAAMLGEITPVDMYPPDTWAQVMQVNLMAPVLITQSMMPLLRDAPAASVVFTSSSVGRKGRAFWGAYAVSKAGVESLSQVLADENEHTGTLRFNAVNPGATRTTMRQRAFPAENPATLKSPEEILDIFLWLLSDDSRGTTGKSFDAQPGRK